MKFRGALCAVAFLGALELAQLGLRLVNGFAQPQHLRVAFAQGFGGQFHAGCDGILLSTSHLSHSQKQSRLISNKVMAALQPQ